MASANKLQQALDKLNWIAGLSKDRCPEGVPGDEQKTRQLLNRIVLDVRAACKLLNGIPESDKKKELAPA